MQVHVASASKKWLPSPTQQFFNLAIIKKERVHRGKIDDEFVLQSIHGHIDDILLAKSPIDLEDIFTNIEGERKVILIDGAPGSGKTTLAIHITQGWGKGELFQEFTIVILVQLRDPAVQSAKSIADLLPCPDIETAQQIASAIKASNGRGILWVMDGWDELPLRLQDDSLLRDMIAPPHISPITLSSVIVTSRPISSGDLCQLVSSRIEVLGFSSEEQRQYFTECLKGDTKAVDALLERLSENPAIEGSCFLPLNASIVAHLYLSDGSLPDTVHGIFSSFVRHFLSRYLCEKLGKTQHSRIVSLDNLSPQLQGAFDEMCRLAFKGTAENKVTFSHSDIEAVKDSAVICEMGLLQATPSILSEGQTVYYNFIHLSVQEFLSAVYISKLPASEQISTFNSLFEEPRFSSVFRYYAAITKLRTSRPFLSKLPRWLIPGSITVHMIDLIQKMTEKRSKPLLVSLLHCLYEARDLSLCKFVAEQLGNELDLSGTSLTPVDCLGLGYFLSTVSLTTSNAKEFKVYLRNCSLGDAGTKSLMCSISRHIDPQCTANTHFDMDLNYNEIHEEGASHIAELLNNAIIVSKFWLDDNPIGNLGLQSIFNILKVNKTLKSLSVARCSMTDTGVSSLASALDTNNTLKTLHIDNNDAITENGLTCLVEVLSRSSGLVKLWIPSRLGVDKVSKTINEARQRSGLAAIKVYYGKYTLTCNY